MSVGVYTCGRCQGYICRVGRDGRPVLEGAGWDGRAGTVAWDGGAGPKILSGSSTWHVRESNPQPPSRVPEGCTNSAKETLSSILVDGILCTSSLRPGNIRSICTQAGQLRYTRGMNKS